LVGLPAEAQHDAGIDADVRRPGRSRARDNPVV